MANLKIFGPPGGRTSRVLWAAKELDLEFERVDVDADMNEESTRLKALQTQQQLGIQSLSIANSSAENILQLFRQ